MVADSAAAKISLRPACQSDAASLAALSIEVWLGTYLHHDISKRFADYVFETLTPDRFTQHLQTSSEIFILSQNQEGIDGFLRLSRGAEPPTGPGSALEIATLYVQPRHQGRGIGQALLQAAVQRGQDLDAPRPWLATNAQNTKAIGFYQRMGFALTGVIAFCLGTESYPNTLLTYCPAPV